MSEATPADPQPNATAPAAAGAQERGAKGQPLLEIRGLRTWFDTDEGTVKAVDGVTYTLNAGETLGVVGESGCGKSVTAMSILQLIPTPPGRYVEGEILFRGKNLLDAREDELRSVRGNDIAMIFQEPMTSLNPVFTVGTQIIEVLRLHRKMNAKDARAYAIEMLQRVGIPAPETRIDNYPHEMSGGMKQRVMIAMALACDPAVLIADEPTTALDVTIQAQILDVLRDMQRELGMSILLITHDLGVVAEMSEHVAVMYAGKIVESTSTDKLFAAPRHPYTFGLFQSLPEMHSDRNEKLHEIPGTVPHPLALPSGCRFRTRCFRAQDDCAAAEPPLQEIEPGHLLACFHPLDAQQRSEHGHAARPQAAGAAGPGRADETSAAPDGEVAS
ncbi:MAG: ABC transporter ATP-binding protein [Planctomycetota bacterium]|nr:MAG: ABC transporter ATP-binding protein [Planctomycetota bacterium]